MRPRMTVQEYRQMQENIAIKNKYNAKKTKYNDRTYDSQREANRAAEIDLLIKAGEVIQVFYQVPFNLPGDITYKADFVILWRDGHWSVEDAKGAKTDVYKLKKKLMYSTYEILIHEV